MAVKIIIRHDTASNWTSFNPTLSTGEIGLETNTKKFKIGDGSTAWTSLAYATNSTSEISSAISAAIDAIDTDDIEEGLTNLYYTESRAKTDAAELLTGATLSNITITGNGSGLTITAENGVADSTTDNLAEGSTNKYFTEERAQDAVGNFVGDGLSYNDSTGAISAQLGSGLEIATGAIVVDTDVIANKTYVGNEISAHAIVTTDVHGVEGDVVGTTDLQTLSNKTLGSALNANSNKITNLATPVDSNDAANKTYVDSAVAGIVDSAPTALNTLNELAAALGDDANFSTTIATSIGEKVAKSGDTMTGALTLSGDPVNVLHAAPKQYVDSEVTAHNRTTNIHGISDTTNLAYIDDVTDAVGNHSDSTTGIHGISDTADLAYKNSPTFTGNVSLPSSTTIGSVTASEIALLSGLTATSTELNTLDGITASTAELNTLDGITASVAELNILDGVTATASEINVLDGITATTSELNILSGVTATAAELNILDGVTATAAELNILDGVTATFAEINILDGVTADALELNILDGATITTTELNTLSGITATASELNTLDGITASTAELNKLDGVTASTAELNILSGATLSTSELNILDGVTATAIELNVLDGITASTIELNYVDGVTSAIQTQLDGKAPTNSPTFTGTVSGITKSMVGLGGVDNTSDADKPISTATQSALDLKADLSGPTFTGNVSLPSTTSIGNVSSTEIGYLDGVTSAVQTQLNSKAPTENPTFTGTVSGITKSMVGLGDVDNTSDADKPISIATQGALDDKLSLSGGTLTGALTLHGAPTSDLHAATKQYVDGVSAGINFHAPVVAATVGNLAGTYDNGTNGFGATLTKASNGSIGTIDGATVSVGSRILVRAQTDAKENGVYTVTAVGSVSAPWQITRATDADNNPSGELAGGDFCFVTAGNTYANTGFILSNTGSVAIGTDNITYVQFNAAQAITAGYGLTKSGGTISVDGSSIAPLADPTFSGTVVLPSSTSIGNVSATEIAHLDGVTSAIQTQLDDKQATITGAATSIVSSDLTPARALVSGSVGKVEVSSVLSSELEYVSGVTSAIQDQLDDKAPIADPTFTGTVTVGASGVAFTDATQTKAGVPSISTFATKTASYTVGADSGLAERDLIILVDSTSSATISIPTDATTNFPVGTSFDVIRLNTGALNIVAVTPGTTSVVATPGLNLRARYSSATCLKIGANSWIVYGDLAS